jgi:hypothetical protein
VILLLSKSCLLASFKRFERKVHNKTEKITFSKERFPSEKCKRELLDTIGPGPSLVRAAKSVATPVTSPFNAETSSR